MCLWDSLADTQRYVKQEWPARPGLEPRSHSHNILFCSLVDPSKIFLPPLHSKLGLMKNFVKALDRDGGGYLFLSEKFKQKSMEKLKAGIFDGLEIRELMKDADFNESLNSIELSTWLALKLVIVHFLGNHRSSEYQKMVDELMENL